MDRTAGFSWIVLGGFFLAGCAGPGAAPPAVPPPEPPPADAPSGIVPTFGDNARVGLVTPAGRHVYIDVWNTSLLEKEPSADDILPTTHMRPDHYFDEFVESFPGKKITVDAGRIELPDVSVLSVVSAHLPADPLEADRATNFLFVIDTAGMRVVHFGDIGQEELTAAQRDSIGAVDLAVTQLSNSFSMMDAAGGKGFRLLEQVRPRLILPTQYDEAALETAVARWEGFHEETRTVRIAPESLARDTGLLLGAKNTVAAYADLFGLKVWQ